MTDSRQPEDQLIEELRILHGRVKELEKVESQREQAEQAMREKVEEEGQLKDGLAILLKVGNRLATMESPDALCRSAVELGRRRLGFDRLSVWFLSEDRKSASGSFGTDEQGETRDERGQRVALQVATRERILRDRPFPAILNENRTLCNDRGQAMGEGDHLCAPMWDGQRIVGFLFADNLLRGRPFTERDAQILALYAAAVGHLHSRKKAEEALRESEQLYRTLVQTLPAGIIVTDLDANITMVNQQAMAFYGYQNTREVLGKSVLGFVSPQEHERVRQTIRQILAEGGARGEEFILLRKDGSSFLSEVTASLVRDAQGGAKGFIGVLWDVTERKRLQQQLFQSQKLESIGKLAGGIAHDFGNLLAVIMGSVSVLQGKRSLPASVQEVLGEIAKAAEQGSMLTEQLLAYARGGLQRPAPTDLNRAVQSVVQVLKRTAPPRIQTVLRLDDDLPTITADATQMEQMVMNLYLNAIEASQPPGTITVRTEQQVLSSDAAKALELPEGRYVCLRVEDLGCGMDPETVGRVFEPFFTTKPMGRGMGLSATLGIIQSHQGQIRIDSAPGQGTTVLVWLPLSTEGAPDRAILPVEPERDQLRGAETILVVDEDPQVAQVAEQILFPLGYCVVHRADCEGALAFLDSNAADIDLILLGLSTPQCPVGEMLAEIEKQSRRVPVLLAGGPGDAQVTERMLKTSAAGFVEKPFSRASLAGAIRKAMNEKEGRQDDSLEPEEPS